MNKNKSTDFYCMSADANMNVAKNGGGHHAGIQHDTTMYEVATITDEERKALRVSPDYIHSNRGWLKYICSESVIVNYLYYGLGIDRLKVCLSSDWNTQAERALKESLSDAEYNDAHLRKQLLKHMRRSYYLAKLHPLDYFMFNLRNKSDAEISEYLSDVGMMELLSKTGARRLHDVELNEKCNFYKIAAPWFKRRVSTIESVEDFDAFAKITRELRKVIVKPASVGCGTGIFIYEYSTEEDLNKTFMEMMSRGSSYIVEQLIVQGLEMASWNPSCINTLRINTFKNKKGVFSHICFMRTGRKGAFVDNGGQGGLFAGIDPATGKIDTDGHDEHGHTYAKHPDSHITYKGWEIPGWHDVLGLAKQIHQEIFPKHPYISWDFAQSVDNEWVLIEGNWGQFVAQQILYGKGVKSQVKAFLKDF